VICHSDIFLENIDIFPVFSINVEQKLTTVVSYGARFMEERGRINSINSAARIYLMFIAVACLMSGIVLIVLHLWESILVVLVTMGNL
jgi:hypothetical protein